MSLLLSVIIPTFRRTESLEKLIVALKSQTLSDLEIIVVDQNPEGFLVNQLPSQIFAGVEYLHLKEPNASSARNFGFNRSRGDYLLFIDDDLQPAKDFCQQGVAALQSHDNVGCVCPVVYSGEHQEQALANLRRHFTGANIKDTGLYEITETISAAIFFKRSYFAQTGGFDELLFRYARTAEDQEFFLRASKRGMKTWLDTNLFIFHDEEVPGGCELRTDAYWNTRARCVKSWVFRHRIHGNRGGKLNLQSLFGLARSSFLNSNLARYSPKHTYREVMLLLQSITESRNYLETHLDKYSHVNSINHLDKRLPPS
jgi:GT2 family glycosyltransferase